ncbi:MAG TPA: asparagine synthase C-terminal domain-containing protein, partial [Thermoanaerobaculia bacterium]|nr:asparagine synthase C-terminal domain-containing protein [Thermoanaerobaculia bacterium]
MFRGVKKLPPAHALVYTEGRLSIRPYWDLPMGETLNGDDPVRRFGELFDRAVESQLMSDVPLGIFLSGGIDSSTVAAAAVRVRPPESVQTFAIGFDDPSYDESAAARLVARHLGTTHHERMFGADTMREVLPKVVERLDEPFGDASLLPTYLLSAFARESVKVALGGDGSDELLMGYPTFRAEAAAQLFRRLPSPLRSAARGLSQYLPVSPRNFSFDFVVRSFLRAADFEDAARHPLWLGSALPGSPDDPLAMDLRRCQPLERVLQPAIDAYRAAPSRNRLERLSYQYCKTYLAEDILHKVDRASMAVSLEARSPFLDRDLLEHIARMPVAFKRRGGSSKIALKRSSASRLPAATLARRKKGFGIPIAAWLRGPLSPMLGDLLAPERVRRSGYLEPRVVNRLVEEHRSGRRNHRKMLWTLLSFELWRERYSIGARS